MKHLNIIGSDRDNFGCPNCNCIDRERHLFMFFDKTNFWDNIPNSNILHFAPESNLMNKIHSLSPKKYIKADWLIENEDYQKIDVTNIPYDDNTFDSVICNHVLEHVEDYKIGMSEIYRVLSIGGIAILQTPVSRLLKNNFSDPNINTNELRKCFYGQVDHCRVFSEETFLNDLRNTGFHLEVIKHGDVFSEEDAYIYGVNKNEDFFRVKKLK
ncbi:MAG: class I SAM-dependent methyltransferase [Chitinophagales bacterium]|nr:class I SAM-dependent methyltransferase [Chitinophagales bacterium]